MIRDHRQLSGKKGKPGKSRSRRVALVLGLLLIAVLMVIAASVSTHKPIQSSRPDVQSGPESSLTAIYLMTSSSVASPFDYGIWESQYGSTGYTVNFTFNPSTFILEITNVTTPSGPMSSVNGTVSQYPVDQTYIMIVDANGSASSQLTTSNEFYMSITAFDSYLVTPVVVSNTSQNLTVGEEWNISYFAAGGGYFIFPGNPFPSFPVSYVDIPNIFALPGYIAAVVKYYGDLANIPYSNPPIISYWSIPYPNLLKFPQWVQEVFVWAVNELVLIFEEIWYRGFVQLTTYATSGVNWGMNLLDSLWNAWTGLIQSTVAGAGIFAPIVTAFFFGITIVVIIGGLYLIYKIIGAVMSLL